MGFFSFRFGYELRLWPVYLLIPPHPTSRREDYVLLLFRLQISGCSQYRNRRNVLVRRSSWLLLIILLFCSGSDFDLLKQSCIILYSRIIRLLLNSRFRLVNYLLYRWWLFVDTFKIRISPNNQLLPVYTLRVLFHLRLEDVVIWTMTQRKSGEFSLRLMMIIIDDLPTYFSGHRLSFSFTFASS